MRSSDDTLVKALEYMDSHPRSGLVGVRLVGRNGELQPFCRGFLTVLNTFLASSGSGRLFSWVHAVDDMSWDYRRLLDCDWAPGCYYFVRREVTEQVGLFDPRYFLYFEEVAHCRAVKAAGWSVDCLHDTEVVRIGGESAKSDAELTAGSRQMSALPIESKLFFLRKPAGALGCAAQLLLTSVAVLLMRAKAVLRSRLRQSIGHALRHVRAMWRPGPSDPMGYLPHAMSPESA